MEAALGFVVRATATYVFLLILVRLAGKRTVGEGTPFDFVIALVLGDFPDDVIWGEVPFAQGVVAMVTVMLLHLVVSYATYRSARVDRVIAGVPTVILRAGRVDHDGMRAERINEGDLDVQLRRQRHEDRRDVAIARVEHTGEVSMLPTDAARPARRDDLAA